MTSVARNSQNANFSARELVQRVVVVVRDLVRDEARGAAV
jgi:hypothetical protein